MVPLLAEAGSLGRACGISDQAWNAPGGRAELGESPGLPVRRVVCHSAAGDQAVVSPDHLGCCLFICERAS